ncbi:MAG: hypothetical protein AAB503_00945 [Patescibacteria group bacterium]
MNQKGFANVVLIILVVVLVGVVGYFAFIKKPVTPTVMEQATNNTPTTQQTPSLTTDNISSQTPLTNETANWKTYRNDSFGVEFKYPLAINGKTVSTVERKDRKDFLMFSSQIPSNQISFSITDLKNSDSVVAVGVDLGGSGGRIYNASGRKWLSRDDSSTTYTWNEMFDYFKKSASPELETIQSTSGQTAFSYAGSAYEDRWEGFRIFETNRLLYLNFLHSIGYADSSIKPEADKENRAIQDALKGIMKTVRFF